MDLVYQTFSLLKLIFRMMGQVKQILSNFKIIFLNLKENLKEIKTKLIITLNSKSPERKIEILNLIFQNRVLDI